MCLLSEAVQYLFVVLFLGSCYPRLSNVGQAAAVDRLAALFMWITSLLVTAPSRALLSWDMERQLLRWAAGCRQCSHGSLLLVYEGRI